MLRTVNVGMIGDFNPANKTHLATNAAIAHSATALGINAPVTWVPTLQIEQAGIDGLRSFDALWCSPGSPYVSMSGALEAIRLAREANIPFFGT